MATHKSAPQTQISADGDDEPQDMEAFRWRMVRRINTFLGTWRACRRPACKRAQACRIMGRPCPALPQAPPPSPEETAHVMAQLYQALRQRVAETDATEAEAGQAAAAPRIPRRKRTAAQ